MDMDTYITIALIAAFLAIVGIVADTIILHVLKRRRANALTSKSALAAGKSLAKGAADTVKKAISEKPPWLMTPLVVSGGWLFLLFSIYVLLPSSVWQWLLAHSEFFWMPPLAIFITQILLTSKKGPAKHLAYAIIFVLAIALVKAIPWSWSDKSSGARGEATERITVSSPSWENCPRIPSNTRRKRETVVLTTPPPGVVSPCYIIERGYRFVTRPEADVQITFRDGRVFHDGPHRAPNFGDTIWNSVFVIKSLTDKPVKVAIEFEKR